MRRFLFFQRRRPTARPTILLLIFDSLRRSARAKQVVTGRCCLVLDDVVRFLRVMSGRYRGNWGMYLGNVDDFGKVLFMGEIRSWRGVEEYILWIEGFSLIGEKLS